MKGFLNCKKRSAPYYAKNKSSLTPLISHRFPFAVLYSESDEELFILAVMHLRREPNYWAHRAANTEGDGK